jgi:hypothetical protein
MTDGTQTALFGVDAAPRRLTERQALVLGLLRESRANGSPGEVVNIALCELRGCRPRNERCEQAELTPGGAFRWGA